MAAKSQTLKDVLICPICMEIFREPVSTPCQHNFCRECLQAFAKRPKPTETDRSSSPLTGPDGEVIISCPMCREPVKLGSKGVAGLRLNLILAEIVEKFQPENKDVKLEPCCSMCEDDSKAAAAMFCSTCSTLYCKECFTVLHPMRGPLTRHSVITVEEYLSQGKTLEPVDPKEESDSPPLCEEHSQQFIIFCVTCEVMMCNDCISKHSDHKIKDIQGAYDSAKTQFVEKIDVLRKTDKAIIQKVTELESVLSDVQCKRGMHKDELTKAFKKATETLKSWHRDSSDDVDQRYDEWGSNCQSAIKELDMKREDIQILMENAKGLLTVGNTVFMKNVRKITSGIDDFLPAGEQSIKSQENLAENLRLSLACDTVTSNVITVREEKGNLPDTGSQVVKSPPVHADSISTQVLKFKRTRFGNLEISLGGSEIFLSSDGWDRAWTNERLQQGRTYWELVVSPNLSDNCDYFSDCTIGVHQEGEEQWIFGQTFWGIFLRYYDDVYKCIKTRVGQEITSAYKKEIFYNLTHSIGCIVDCDARLLKFLDLSQNRVMCIVNNINTEKPLVPVVSLYGVLYTSVRLVAPCYHSLPQLPADILGINQ